MEINTLGWLSFAVEISPFAAYVLPACMHSEHQKICAHELRITFLIKINMKF